MQNQDSQSERPPAPFASREAIDQWQSAKLRRLLTTAIPASEFYHRKLAATHGDGHFTSLADFAARFPFTRKQELVADQEDHPPYGSNLTRPVGEFSRCHQTSGTTGAPLRWLDTPQSWAGLLDNWQVIYDAAGLNPSDRLFFAFSFGPFIGFWSALEAASRQGCFVFAGGSMTSRARLDAILDNRITVLCCTPTYALHLGETARGDGLCLDRSSVRLVIVAGEAGGSIPTTRQRIEAAWPGARVYDHHGMTETGPVTFECPEEPGVLHVLDHSYFAEVVNPANGHPLTPGETGELVLTTLDRLGSPLLRYRTGDLVRMRPPGRCACGRYETALLGGILGRADQMIIVRGVNLYPSGVEEIIRSLPEILEYRATVDCRAAMTELSLQIEVGPETPQPELVVSRLQASLQSRFSLRIPVTLAPTGSLPRFEMKSRRWVRLTG